MTTSVYSIRLEREIRQMMEEMDDVNWQTEIKQIVEKMIRERKKQRILARAQERWNDQVPNDRGAAVMIREDRDAR
jgi:methionyl-tRNA synthetase